MSAARKLFSLLVVVLALNFLGMAVALAMLAQRAQLDRVKLAQIKDVLFPPSQQPAEAADAAEPAPPPEPTPMEQLMALLDAQAGKPVEARVTELRETFDDRAAALARAARELADRQRLADAAAKRLADDRTALEQERAAWAEQVADAVKRAADAGFRQSLTLYEQMPPKQAKAVLLLLDDEVALSYLRAMDPRAAGRLLKEFKDGPETEKVKTLLELMRQGDPATAAAAMGEAAGTAPPPAAAGA